MSHIEQLSDTIKPIGSRASTLRNELHEAFTSDPNLRIKACYYNEETQTADWGYLFYSGVYLMFHSAVLKRSAEVIPGAYLQNNMVAWKTANRFASEHIIIPTETAHKLIDAYNLIYNPQFKDNQLLTIYNGLLDEIENNREADTTPLAEFIKVLYILNRHMVVQNPGYINCVETDDYYNLRIRAQCDKPDIAFPPTDLTMIQKLIAKEFTRPSGTMTIPGFNEEAIMWEYLLDSTDEQNPEFLKAVNEVIQTVANIKILGIDLNTDQKYFDVETDAITALDRSTSGLTNPPESVVIELVTNREPFKTTSTEYLKHDKSEPVNPKEIELFRFKVIISVKK